MAKLAATTFAGLDKFLGNKSAKTIGNNTTAERDGGPFDPILVRLHGHEIASLFPDGTVNVRDAGYQTVTTKERINQFLPLPYRVSQKSYVWHVWTTSAPDAAPMPWNGSLMVFPDGGAAFPGVGIV